MKWDMAVTMGFASSNQNNRIPKVRLIKGSEVSGANKFSQGMSNVGPLHQQIMIVLTEKINLRRDSYRKVYLNSEI